MTGKKAFPRASPGVSTAIKAIGTHMVRNRGLSLRQAMSLLSLQDGDRPVYLEHEDGQTISRMAGISKSTLNRVVWQWDESGQIARDGRSSGEPRSGKLSQQDKNKLIEIVNADPTMYLEEMRYTMLRETGKWVDTSTIWRQLRKAGYTRKVVTFQHITRSAAERVKFMKISSEHDYRDFVWVDETSSQLRRHGRNRGYGPEGKRVRVVFPRMLGCRYSLIASMSAEGAGPCWIVSGAINRARFLYWIEYDLLPWMNPHFNADGSPTGLPQSVLCLDNCSTHRCLEFYTMCVKRRIKVVFLPPYTPEYNPIELAFNTYKSLLKRVRPILLSYRGVAPPIGRRRRKGELEKDSGRLQRVLLRLWRTDVGKNKSIWHNWIRKAGYVGVPGVK